MNMKRHMKIPDEQLNAFIDDELDFEEKEYVFQQLNRDEALIREAQELRHLRSLMRHAYRHPPSAPSLNQAPRGMRATMVTIAAGLLLGIGVTAGWYGNARFTNDAGDAAPLSAVVTSQENLLLHLDSNDPAKMERLLNYAEQQLAAKRERGQTFRLEVVANDGGVELLRQDTSPFPDRIQALLREYDNVSFLACANALRKLQERGIKVELLPGTHSDHTALDKIIERLEGGWRYIKL